MLDSTYTTADFVSTPLAPGEAHRLVKQIEQEFGGFVLNTASGREVLCHHFRWEYVKQECHLVVANDLLARWPVLRVTREPYRNVCRFDLVEWKSEYYCESSGIFAPAMIGKLLYSQRNFRDNSLLTSVNRWLTS